MSTAKCEEELSGPKAPKGITGYIKTTVGNQLDCQISRKNSEYRLEITNHNKHAVGIRVECKSVNGDVEFKNGSTYKNMVKDSIFLKPRSSSSTMEEIQVDVKPCHQNSTDDEIKTKLKVHRIFITNYPDVDVNIEIDVN
jgi:hypothetical protein